MRLVVYERFHEAGDAGYLGRILYLLISRPGETTPHGPHFDLYRFQICILV